MQRVLVSCQEKQKNGITHTLKINNYKPIEFMSENQSILFMELQDYQLDLLVKLVHDYMKVHDCIVTVSVCHKISFY